MSTAAGLHPQVDMELKKAFEELQVKILSNRSQQKVISTQTDYLKRQIQHSKLTESEIQQLSESVRMYEGVGRMFVLSEKNMNHLWVSAILQAFEVDLF